MLSCAVRDSRSDRTSETRAKFCETRASRDAMLPDVVTILVGATYTGRPSSPNENRAFGAKLRSTDRGTFWLSENVPSMFAMNRAPRIPPFHERFDRTLRCGWKRVANSVTFGAE